MRLSLIICTYQRPEPLVRLLDSVRAQTAPPDEIIIVDGSVDTRTTNAMGRYAQHYPDLPLLYIRVDAEQRGLTRQRNIGIAKARFDIIAFLDDDTVLSPEYLESIRSCYEAHPEALGVGGYIDNEVVWEKADTSIRGNGYFEFNGWRRRESIRMRIRTALGLAPRCDPGRMPPEGHGLSLSYYPPDGATHRVEFLMGGASSWRASVFERHAFSTFFEGYGLYEDLDFSTRVMRDGPLFVCTRARLSHLHEPAGRPNQFRYGYSVTWNGWYVWRGRWPSPGIGSRFKWWATGVVLVACRALDAVRGPNRMQALTEATGRLAGFARLLVTTPKSR